MEKDETKEDPVLAWNSDDESDDTKEPKVDKNEGTQTSFDLFKEPKVDKNEGTQTSFDLFKEYTEYSTIQGLAYIFFDNQMLIGKVFWSVVVLFLVCLGLYWTIYTYQDWQGNPVITTISTTAYAVNQVDYPAVTFCSPGYNIDIFAAGSLNHFFNYMRKINASKLIDETGLTPLEVARLALMVQRPQTDLENLTENEIRMINKALQAIASSGYINYLQEYFPGLPWDADLRWAIPLVDKNPDMSIAAIVASDGINTCINSTHVKCGDPNSKLDTANNLCYEAATILNDEEISTKFCSDKQLLQFESEAQVQGLLFLFQSGNITLPVTSNETFYLNTRKTTDGSYVFANNKNIDIFPSLVLEKSTVSLECLSAQYIPGYNKFKLIPTSCISKHATICRMLPENDTTCSKKGTETLEFLLNPKLSTKKNETVSERKEMYRSTFANLNKTMSYIGLFRNLWYATLPCSDLRNITSDSDGEASILRYCEWKGEPISCATIFQSFPTDRGICCSFNMKAAENIFQESVYTNLITELQNQDKDLAFLNTTPPEDYINNNEPASLPGQNNGLLVILDAHTDLLYTASMDSDYKGFSGVISQSGSFPFTMFESFNIRPGHINLIALSGTRIDADDGLRSLNRIDRNCMFSDENDTLKIHRTYSYTNCIFECILLYAKDKLKQLKNSTYACTPWYFPSDESAITICDPWEAVDFLRLMTNNIPEGSCSYCFPDCSNTIYDTSVMAIPFQRCGIFNFGVSPMCSLDNSDMPQPRKYGSQVLAQYQTPYPEYLDKIKSNIRYYNDLTLFQNEVKAYDAYEQDIAMVQVYFKKATIFQMNIQSQMTWIGFFANVGGLMGLVLGMGIVSVIELFWLCLRIIANKYNLTKWIR